MDNYVFITYIDNCVDTVHSNVYTFPALHGTPTCVFQWGFTYRIPTLVHLLISITIFISYVHVTETKYRIPTT